MEDGSPHFLIVGGLVMFCVIITQIFLTWAPINNKLAFVTSILKQIKTNINSFGRFLFYGFIGKTNRCGVIDLNGGCGVVDGPFLLNIPLLEGCILHIRDQHQFLLLPPTLLQILWFCKWHVWVRWLVHQHMVCGVRVSHSRRNAPQIYFMT